MTVPTEHSGYIGYYVTIGRGVYIAVIFLQHEGYIAQTARVARKFVAPLHGVLALPGDFDFAFAHEGVTDLLEHGCHHLVEQMMTLNEKISSSGSHTQTQNVVTRTLPFFPGFGIKPRQKCGFFPDFVPEPRQIIGHALNRKTARLYRPQKIGERKVAVA